MAEAFPNVGVPCRYFQHGTCWNERNCLFAHDPSVQLNNTAVDPFTPAPYAIHNGGGPQYCDLIPFHSSPFAPAPMMSQQQFPVLPVPMVGQQFPILPMPSAFLGYSPARGSIAPPAAALLHRVGAPTSTGMVTLTKNGVISPGKNLSSESSKLNGAEWVKAPEFVPGRKWLAAGAPGTYLEKAQVGLPTTTRLSADDHRPFDHPSTLDSPPTSKDEYLGAAGGAQGELCPYAAKGECPFVYGCTYVHGDVCDLCGHAALSPYDQQQRQQHTTDCIKAHEADMEMSFAVQRSKDKACGICMDVVWEKLLPSERCFGILSDCVHTFCLECIRKWRSAKQFENKIIRACPECRVKSNFVTPSKYWVEDKEEKTRLIDSYKKTLSQKPCKHFDQGRGTCPFNDKCFYLHAYPDGRVASPRTTLPRLRQNADGEIDVVRHLMLWDVIDEINDRRSELSEARMLLGDMNDDLNELFLHLNMYGTGESSDDEEEGEENGVRGV